MVWTGPVGPPTHVGGVQWCLLCGEAWRAGIPYAEAARLHREAISLDAARRRVGTTMHVAPQLWAWKPGEIRWLARQWRMTLPLDLRPARRTVGDRLRGWWFWLPAPIRILVAVNMILQAFAWVLR